MVGTESFLQVARETAKESGHRLLSKFGKIHEMNFKGEIDPVTEADKESEKFIVERLRDAFPQHGILSEEGSQFESDRRFLWIVDPLDGTTNYAHGFPLFSVSIGLVEDNKPLVGVVYVPRLDEEFYAIKGEGAFLNGRPVRVSKKDRLEKAFLTTGVPYSVRSNLDFHVGLFKKFMDCSLAIRRGGSACIDLCYVACGRFDGYWESGLKPWDVAAGLLILEEAGGIASDYQGEAYILRKSNSIVASNGLLHKSMLQILSS